MGKLTHKRQLLVKNKHLSPLAEKLKLSDFMLRNLKATFSKSSATHLLSNCLEAVIGAIFLDGGLEEADNFYSRIAFPEEVKF